MDIKVEKNTVVVFDLDDTLYNEMSYLQSAYREIAKSLDPGNWKELYVFMLSLFRCKLDVFGKLEDVYHVKKADLLTSYRQHIPIIQPFEGAVQLLEQIKNLHGRIGILTDGRETTQMNKIVALGIKSYLDKIVISESIGTEKPHVKNFQEFESSFPNCNYYYIADNLRKDFLTPNSRGWNTIGLIDNGLNMHPENYKFFDSNLKPHDFIFTFGECRIIEGR